MDSAHFSFLHPQQTRSMRTDAVEVEDHVLVHRTYQNYNIFGIAKLFENEVSGPLDVTFHGLGVVVNRTRVDAKLVLHYTFAFFFTPVDEEHVEVSCRLSMRKLKGGMLFNEILMRKAIREGKKTIDQHIPIWTNKLYRERPNLCEDDGPIMRYRNWAKQFYELVQRTGRN